MPFQEQARSWRSKAHLSGVRLPVLVGMTALVVVVLVFAGKALVEAASSDGFSVQRSEEVPAQSGDVGADGEEAPSVVFVHVGGAVADPGVRELKEGSRVQDSVEAAGGFAENAAPDALNLARVVADGEQVIVPTIEQQEASAAGAAASEASASSGGLVNINAATAAELDALPGIGPATAEKIVADREANGPFSAIEDIKRVSGIGEKKYADLAGSICVG